MSYAKKGAMRRFRPPRTAATSSISWIPTVLGVSFLMVVFASSVLIAALVPSASTPSMPAPPLSAEELAGLEVRSVPYTCPTLELSHQPGGTEFGGICIAWYNATTLYYFKNIGGDPHMIALTYDENRTTVLSQSDNLFSSPSIYGSAFMDCTYYASNDTFVLISSDPNVYVFSPTGEKLHETPLTLAGPASGNREQGTSLFYDENNQFYIDDTWSNAFVGQYRTLDVDTGVIGDAFVITDELTQTESQQRVTGAERNVLDNRIYALKEYAEQYEPPTQIVVLDLNSSTFKPTCLETTAQAKLASITFDVDGVAWVATGGNAQGSFSPQSIYRYSGPIFPLDATAATTFSLQCTENAVGFVATVVEYPERNATVVGSGCFGSQIRVYSSNQTENYLIPTVAIDARPARKSSVKKSNAPKFNDRSVEATCAVAHQHVSAPANMTVEFNATSKRTAYSGDVIGSSSTSTSQSSTTIRNDLSEGIAILEDPVPLYYRLLRLYSNSNGGVERHQLSVGLGFGPGGIGQYELTSSVFTGDCLTFDNQRAAAPDHEENRFVFGWITAARSKLCLALTGGNNITSFDLYEFDFPSQNISKMNMAVWGDYYTVCWNDLNAPNPWANCYVIEKARMINTGMGMPRIMPVPKPSIVYNSGQKATATTIQQPANNGPRTPVMNAFPCGLFAAITANLGGVLDLKLCETVDFDTSTIVASDSLTTIGAYDNGSSGTCTSETQCIDTITTELDPNRYDVTATYRRFPFLGNIEQIGIAITVNANGAGDSAILAGRFTINATGHLEGTVQTFDPTTENQWDPDVVFTPDATLWIGYRNFVPADATANLLVTRWFYNATGLVTPQIVQNSAYQPPSGTKSIEQGYAFAIPGYNSTITVLDTITTCDSVCQRFFYATNILWNAEQRFARRFYAYDDCNQEATCLTSIDFVYRANYSLPST